MYGVGLGFFWEGEVEGFVGFLLVCLCLVLFWFGFWLLGFYGFVCFGWGFLLLLFVCFVFEAS